MIHVPNTAATRPSAARERLLETATSLFYREGIHAVGVDRILGEAGVTRATMYRHFAGKEDLVVAYLEEEDRAIRGYFAASDAAAGPGDGGALLSAVVHGIAEDVATRHTRGCPFINAAAEYPDPASPVRRLVATHRAWFRDALRQVAARADLPQPDAAAAQLVLLRDAALIGAYLDEPRGVREAFVSAASTVTGRAL